LAPPLTDMATAQSIQMMLIDRRPATQRCADSEPGGFVDVQRQRELAATHTPERP